MPVNLELKARLASMNDAGARAQRFEFAGDLQQTDTYFRVPNGRLKLRVQKGKPSELIFYCRTEEAPERLSDYRKEQLSDHLPVLKILSEALGVLAIVEKTRHLYLYRGARVHLDEVKGLGAFVEFEVPAGREATDETMKELREIFAIEETDVIKCSYSDMILGESFSREA